MASDYVLTIKVRSTGEGSRVLAEQEDFCMLDNGAEKAQAIVRQAMSADEKKPARVAVRVAVRAVGTSRGLCLKRMCAAPETQDVAGAMAKSICDQIRKAPPGVDLLTLGAQAMKAGSGAVESLQTVAAWAQPAAAVGAAIANGGGAAAAVGALNSGGFSDLIGGLAKSFGPALAGFAKSNPDALKSLAAVGEQLAQSMGIEE